MGRTLVDIVVGDPTRRDLVERAARQDLVAATDAERREESQYRDRATGTILVPFALETYGALSDRSDRFLVECAMLASRECAGSGQSMQDWLVVHMVPSKSVDCFATVANTYDTC